MDHSGGVSYLCGRRIFRCLGGGGGVASLDVSPVVPTALVVSNVALLLLLLVVIVVVVLLLVKVRGVGTDVVDTTVAAAAATWVEIPSSFFKTCKIDGAATSAALASAAVRNMERNIYNRCNNSDSGVPIPLPALIPLLLGFMATTTAKAGCIPSGGNIASCTFRPFTPQHRVIVAPSNAAASSTESGYSMVKVMAVFDRP